MVYRNRTQCLLLTTGIDAPSKFCATISAAVKLNVPPVARGSVNVQLGSAVLQGTMPAMYLVKQHR